LRCFFIDRPDSVSDGSSSIFFQRFFCFRLTPFGQVIPHQPPLVNHLRQIFDRSINDSFPLINKGYSAKIMLMKKKSLIETNRYLKDPAEREAGIILSVATSSAIEGIPLSVFNSFVTTRTNQSGKTVSASAKSTRSLRRKSSPSQT